jgi:hypothetical protein
MITERAMLAAVHISIWTAIKHDRRVSREGCRAARSLSRRRPLQQTAAPEAERLESLRSLPGQIRQYFYKITLPWSDEGHLRIGIPRPLASDIATRHCRPRSGRLSWTASRTHAS